MGGPAWVAGPGKAPALLSEAQGAFFPELPSPFFLTGPNGFTQVKLYITTKGEQLLEEQVKKEDASFQHNS